MSFSVVRFGVVFLSFFVVLGSVRSVHAELIVGNITNAHVATGTIGFSGPNVIQYAVGFQMGGVGYEVTNVLTIVKDFGAMVTAFYIATDSNGVPGEVVGTFMDNPSVTTQQVYAFPAVSPIPLLPNTNYWMVFKCASGVGDIYHRAAGYDGTAAAVFTNIFSLNGGSLWQALSVRVPLRLEGVLIPPPQIQILSWDFAGNGGNEIMVPATYAKENMQATSVSRGAGIAAAARLDTFYASQWIIDFALDASDYIEIPVTPVPGYKYTVTGLVFKIVNSGAGAGPQSWALRSSKDGYTGTVDSWFSDAASHTRTIAIAGCVDETTTTGFRLYGYGNSSGDEAGLGGTGEDVLVYGSVMFDATGDADGDGIRNDWELEHYGSPTGAIATVDDDGDYVNAYGEYIADSDPFDSNSYHRVTQIMVQGPPEIFFPSSTNRVYSLTYSDNLLLSGWTPVPGQTNLPGNGTTNSVTDTNMLPNVRSYRVDVALP